MTAWLIVDQAPPGEPPSLAAWQVGEGDALPVGWRVVRGGLTGRRQAERVIERMNRINEEEDGDA